MEHDPTTPETHKLEATHGIPRGGRIAVGSRIGRYVILSHAGSGGMGEVYEAYDPHLDRKVALKMLLEGARQGRTDRLLREAKAMAKLSHPNVVQVHDAGESEAGIFVAMAFVAGKTLQAWLDERPRRWPEVLAAFAGAGRGLQAAHGAGIIHRDFKPENVLVDGGGRVLVTDFGLARAAGDPNPAPAAWRPGLEPWTLTREGALVGTPQFMAAEQLEPGRGVDERSDIYAFCVSLYLGLYGAHPYPAESMEGLRRAVRAGRVVEPAAAAAIPRPLRQLLLRGLRPDPAERPRSMGEVVEALEEAVRPRGRRLALAAAAALALGAVALIAARAAAPATEAVCSGGASVVSRVWSPGVRARLAAAYRVSGQPGAAESGADLERGLDRYFGGWARAHREACEATAVRHEQSEHVLDLRMACLERLRTEAAALLDVVLGGDGPTLEAAPRAVGSLGDVAACAQTDRLLAEPPRPSDAAVQKRVHALEEALAHTLASFRLGRDVDALREAKTVLAEARLLGHLPLVDRALLMQARIDFDRGRYDETAASAAEALTLAGRTHDDAQSLLAFKALHAALRKASRLDEAHGVGLAWRAAAERAGDPRSRADALEESAMLALARKQREEAKRLIDEALVLRERAPRDPAVDVGAGYQLPWTYLNQAIVMDDEPERMLAAARMAMRRAIELRDPNVGFFHRMVAWRLQELGRQEEARAVLTMGLAMAAGRHGSQGSRVDALETDLAAIELDDEDFVSARARLEHALALVRARRTEGTMHSIMVRQNLTHALIGLGRADEAGATIDGALDILAATWSPTHALVPEVLLDAVDARLAQGQLEAAGATAARALALAEGNDDVDLEVKARARGAQAALACLRRLPGKTAAGVRDARAALESFAPKRAKDLITADLATTLGDCLMADGQPGAAVAPYQQALDIRLPQIHGPRLLQRTRDALARAQAAAARRPH